MNKTELIKAVCSKLDGATQKDIDAVIGSLSEVITEELQAGGEVTIPGVGKLTVVERAARAGRNPATGETIQIPASKAPKFKAVKALKDAVNA